MGGRRPLVSPVGAGEEAPELSIVIPVYNEVANLDALVQELNSIIPRFAPRFEVILVDDGSTDGGDSRLDAIALANPRFRVIHFKRNAGQSAALEAGFRAAWSPLVATMDADLQNDPSDLGAFLAELEHADAVVGVRKQRSDSWIRRISSQIGNAVRNAITGDHITDTGCSLKLFRAAYLRRIKMYVGMHRFLPTLLRQEGARVIELTVHHRPRLHGKSKYGIANRALRGLVDCLAVRWMGQRRLRYQYREAPGERISLDTPSRSTRAANRPAPRTRSLR